MELTPYQKDVINAKICPYCKSTTKVVSETDIYGKEYRGRKIIACVNYPKCDAYVGTHDDGSGLGRLANKKLRLAKGAAHKWFDKIWREKMAERNELYERLADYLNIPDEFTHIGMFGVETCKKVEIWAFKTYDNNGQDPFN